MYRRPEANSTCGPGPGTLVVTGDTEAEAVAGLKRQLRQKVSDGAFALSDTIILNDPHGVHVQAGCGTVESLLK